MTRTLPLSEVKMKLSKLIEAIFSKDDEVIITRNGKPVAVILSATEHENWKETQEIKANTELMGEIREGVRALENKAKTKHVSLDELFGKMS